MSPALKEKLQASIKHCRDAVLRQKVDLFLRALHLGSVQAACREVGKAPRYYYYWWNRFRDAGFKLEALQKKSRRPKHSPRQIPEAVAKKISAYRKTHPHSTEMIRLLLEKDHQIRVSRATVYRVLKRKKLLGKRTKAKPSLPSPRRPLALSPARRVDIPPLFTPRLLQNRYWLEKPLGSGGGGVVYLAKDRRDKNETVAVKILEIEKLPDSHLIETLKGEFSALAALRHRNLARVHDFGISLEEVFFTSEFVPGQNILQVASRANLNTVFDLMLQILRALDFLHGRGVLHLDLKPENILVADPQGSGELCVKLIDFGGAQWKKRGKIFAGAFIGTPPYTPPEVILEQPPSPASDIYSLGILFHQIFAGKLPFHSSDPVEMMKEQVYGGPQRTTQLHPALPENFADLLSKMIEKDPAKRLPSPQAVVEALNDCLSENFSLRGKDAPHRIVSDSDYGFRSLLGNELVKKISSGRPQTIVLSGPAGIGKTRLLRRIKNALQLAGLHPEAIEERAKLEEFLKNGPPPSSEPLFIDGIDWPSAELVTLLDRLENLRRPVLLATTLPASLELNPHCWISLETLSEAELLDFLESEVADFPTQLRGGEAYGICQGDLGQLEALLQAMHEEGWLQWSEQGWSWIADLDAPLRPLLKAQEERWAQHLQQVKELLKFSPLGMSARTLAGILNLEIEGLAEKLTAWEGAGLLHRKLIRHIPHYFLTGSKPPGKTERLIHDWTWAREELERLYRAGAFPAGVELSNVIFSKSKTAKIPEPVALACARHYVAAGYSKLALQSLPASPPKNLNRRGMYFEIMARAGFDSETSAAMDRKLSDSEQAYASADDALGLSRIFNLKASLCKKRGEFSAAEAAYGRAIAEAERGRDPYPQGMAQMNLAILFYERGKFELAQKNYQKAFALEKIADQPLLSTKLRDNWVNLLFYTGRSAEAETACYELFKLSLKFGYIPQQAAALTYLALLAGQKNNPELQLHYLNQALGILQPQQSPLLYFHTLIDRGYVYWNLKKFTAAQLDAEAALDLAGRSANTVSQAIASLLLGKILRDRPKPDAEGASEHLNNAHRGILKNQIGQLLWEVEYDRGLLAKKREETARARNYFLSAQQHLEGFLQGMPEEFRKNFLRDRKLERIQTELEAL